MGFGAPPSAFSDAELNGLVDGHLESGRKAELVQRLNSYAADRARVAAWREQNELLRASFSEVDQEPIPLSLSLTPPPRLRCVATDTWSETRRTVAGAPPVQSVSAKRTRQGIISLGALVGCVGLFGYCLVTEHPMAIDPPALLLAATGRADGMLVTQTFDASDSALKSNAALENGKPRKLGRDLPTATIPDLGDFGFGFTEAKVQGTEPVVLVFVYQNAAADRLALSVSKIAAKGRTDLAMTASTDNSVTWRRHGTAFTLGGTPDLHRLNAIAAVLQAKSDEADEPQ